MTTGFIPRRDVYPGGDLYVAPPPGQGNFVKLWVMTPADMLDANFRLRGSLVR